MLIFNINPILTPLNFMCLSIDVFIWEDLGEARLASRHRLVPNGNYLMAPAKTGNTTWLDAGTQPMRSEGKRSEVKAGDRLPQGVDNEAELAETEAAVEEDDSSRAQERVQQYCGPPENNLQGEEGMDNVLVPCIAGPVGGA